MKTYRNSSGNLCQAIKFDGSDEVIGILKSNGLSISYAGRLYLPYTQKHVKHWKFKTIGINGYSYYEHVFINDYVIKENNRWFAFADITFETCNELIDNQN